MKKLTNILLSAVFIFTAIFGIQANTLSALSLTTYSSYEEETPIDYDIYYTQGKVDYTDNQGVNYTFVDEKTAEVTQGFQQHTILGSGGLDYYSGSNIAVADIVIPAEIEGRTVVGIGDIAFANAELNSVVLPETLKYIGWNGFFGCGFEQITVPNSLENIGYGAFTECSALKSFKIPEKISVIDEFTFSECSALEEINLENITFIGQSAFYECENLTKVVLNNSLTAIERLAFVGTGLTEITIPTATEIGEKALGYAKGTGLIYATALTPNYVIYGTANSPAEEYARAAGIKFVEVRAALSTRLKSVMPTSAEFVVEKNSAEAKGAVSYVLLKGDYSNTDFSNYTFEDLKNHPDFVSYEVSKWTKNCKFRVDYLDDNQTYTIVPFSVKRNAFYFVGIGGNTVFTTPYFDLKVKVDTLPDNSVQVRLSRIGTPNGALGFVLLKGEDFFITHKTLEEYAELDEFVTAETSSWTGRVTFTLDNLEKGEPYHIYAYTKKGDYYYFPVLGVAFLA
jgi:hypothetical protein